MTFRFGAAVVAVLLLLLLPAADSMASEVIIIGDTQLKPVLGIIEGIRETLKTPASVYSPSDIKGRLNNIVSKEGASTVIALGKDAIDDALQLPPAVSVIYDLVIVPPPGNRPNTTGMYMATPIGEYISLIKKYLPPIKRISVVSNHDLTRTLGGAGYSQLTSHNAGNSAELVSKIKQLEDVDALLLLPDVNTLTSSATEEIYLFSFRKKIPLLGISERHVRQGALLALVFDPVTVGRKLGERASDALSGVNIGKIPPSPSQKFDLFINMDTARKMGIAVPDEMLKRAKQVYP